MKKKSILILAALLMVVSLTSCMRMEMDITIKKNGKMDVNVVCALNESMASLSDLADAGIVSEEQLEEQRKAGWDVEEYHQDGFIGYRMSKTNIDPKEGEKTIGFDMSDGVVTKQGSTYILDFNAFGNAEDQADAAESLEMIKAFGSSVKIRVTFPVKPTNHNAANVSEDGKTLEWDFLGANSDGNVHAEFKMGGGFLKYAAIMSAVTVAAVAGFLAFSRKKK